MRRGRIFAVEGNEGIAERSERGTYGTMYGMRKTTIYLPDELKAALERVAAAEGQSEAELIRAALREKIAAVSSSRPTVPLASAGLGDPSLAERVDELLAGFGTE